VVAFSAIVAAIDAVTVVLDVAESQASRPWPCRDKEQATIELSTFRTRLTRFAFAPERHRLALIKQNSQPQFQTHQRQQQPGLRRQPGPGQ
jgi:hypothetical protein